jgi:predicted nucleic acid-binding protein
MMINAVFDACVLYSAPLRDFVLRLAEDDLVVPYWSNEINDEWTRNLLRNRPDLKQENLERTRQNMDTRFPRGLVTGYESIIPTLALSDPNDRHVLAVAIHVQAEYIVTFNLDDFPNAVLKRYGIEAVPPDEWVMRLIQESPFAFFRSVKKHRLSLTRPSKTVEEYLATLEKQGLSKTVMFLREHKDDI